MSSDSDHPNRRWPLWLAAVVVLLAGGGCSSGDSKTTKSGAKKGGGPIPVAVDKVKQGDMGVYISALGTVTPVYTVAITSRVAGQLMNVNYREGQFVLKGELLAAIDSRPYDAAYEQAVGQLERDQALLTNARTDLERYKAAFAQHAIPEQTMVTQQATINQYEGIAKLDQGSVDAANVNVQYTKITSPISGRVGLRQIDPGNIVQANGTTPLVTVTQLQPITVIFSMAEDYVHDVAAQLRAGNKLRVDALDRTNQTLVAEGTVLTLDNSIDATTGTVKVRASFANGDLRLFPNEFVNAKLLVKTLKDVSIVPTSAIQRNNDAAYVYVVDPETKKVKSTNVTVTATSGLQAAVTGVAPDQTVVTDGFDKLQDNTQVAVRRQK